MEQCSSSERSQNHHRHEASLARLRKDSNIVPYNRKVRGRRLTLWSSVQAPGLVEFLLHPIPHSGTQRRLFPCELHREASRFVTPSRPHLRCWRAAIARATVPGGRAPNIDLERVDL